MDPLDTMTATDWRRVYERQLARITGLQDDLIAARRREAELVGRLRRREEHVRDDIAARIFADEQECQTAIEADPTNAWMQGRLVGLQRARDIAGQATVDPSPGNPRQVQ